MVEVFAIFSLCDKYEKSEIVPSDHQLFVDQVHPMEPIIRHQLHTNHGARCLITSSALSSAEIEL
jgi:hypothetical protein